MWNNTIGRLYKVYCYRNMMLFVYHIKDKETLDITEGQSSMNNKETRATLFARHR